MKRHQDVTVTYTLTAQNRCSHTVIDPLGISGNQHWDRGQQLHKGRLSSRQQNNQSSPTLFHEFCVTTVSKPQLNHSVRNIRTDKIGKDTSEVSYSAPESVSYTVYQRSERVCSWLQKRFVNLLSRFKARLPINCIGLEKLKKKKTH